MNESAIITSTVNEYIDIFLGFYGRFFGWGQWLFFGLLTLSFGWMFLWYAFDKNSFQEAMSDFLKEFFKIMIFFVVMTNAIPYLGALVNSAAEMGMSLTGSKVDPSSIISNGLSIGNRIIGPVKDSNVLFHGFALFVTTVAYGIVLFAFISIALDLAVTLISAYFLISFSGFLLAFSALPITRQIARKTLDNILAKSIKLLVLYILIAAGNGIFNKIANFIPTDEITSFDIYGWVCAAALLFWLLAKNLSNEVARIVSESIQENRGVDAAAIALSAVRTAGTAVSGVKMVTAALQGLQGGVAGMASTVGSGVANAAAHFSNSRGSGVSMAESMGTAIKGSSKDIAQAVGSKISDQFKNVANKMAGGEGIAGKTPNGQEKPIQSVANRIYEATQAVKANSPNEPLTPPKAKK